MPLALPEVRIPLGQFSLSLHPIIESLAYLVGFKLYNRQRSTQGDFLSNTARLSIVAAAIAGAFVGSKLLGWLEQPWLTLRHWRDPAYLMGGKTIVGAILGGTMAVEWIKQRMGIARRTGDLFAVPLCVATAVGRVGCLLGGLSDRTFGIAASVPWAVDFGDGIPRHPTQAYEILAMLALAALLHRFDRHPHPEGDTFRLFVLSYSAWRLAIDFLKPDERFAGLGSIQWACAFALVWYARDLRAILQFQFQQSSIAAHG